MKKLDNLVGCDVMAAKLGYHIQYLRDLARFGKIPAIKRGRAWLFDETEVVEHLQKQTDALKKGSNHGRRTTDAGSDLLR